METVDRNRIHLESTIAKQAVIPLYEETVTRDEFEFLVKLFEVVENLVKEDEKVSLLRIGKILNIAPSELYDYMDEILKFETRSISRFRRNS